MTENKDTSFKGLIHVYTGDGKGKTTAALGLALRASGHGLKVIFIQFVKGDRNCGEHIFVACYHPFELVQLATGDSFTKPLDELRSEAEQTLAYAEEAMLSGKYNVVILDEIFVAINKALITTHQVVTLVDKKPDSVELVLTGRGAPREVIMRADYVTEMLMIKHPFIEGTAAREGIEY